MGFEAGFNLRNKETKKQHSLCYLGRSAASIDSMLMNSSTKSTEKIISDDGEEFENDDFEYVVDYDYLENVFNKFSSCYRIFKKYSDRVICQLEEYYETEEDTAFTEMTKDDLSIIKDTLWELDMDLYSIWALYNFLKTVDTILSLDEDLFDDFDIIYWRSY